MSPNCWKYCRKPSSVVWYGRPPTKILVNVVSIGSMLPTRWLVICSLFHAVSLQRLNTPTVDGSECMRVLLLPLPTCTTTQQSSTLSVSRLQPDGVWSSNEVAERTSLCPADRHEFEVLSVRSVWLTDRWAVWPSFHRSLPQSRTPTDNATWSYWSRQTGVDREAAAWWWWSGCYGADMRLDDQSQGCACVVDLPAVSIRRKRRISVNIKQRQKSHTHACTAGRFRH